MVESSKIQTTYRAFCYNLDKPEEKAQWQALKKRLKRDGRGRIMESWSWDGDSHYRPKLDGTVLTLETEHVFDNQWNTTPVAGVSDRGLRVFDWALDATGPEMLLPKIKRGHYLDLTSEMVEIRKTTKACGYCGFQTQDENVPAFCEKCIGTEYLEAKHLPLLRLVPIGHDRGELNKDEKAILLPQYKDAQLYGRTARDKARIAKQRAKLSCDRDHTITNANAKYYGMTWLMDRGIKIDNVIYYDHTGVFCFGWRKALDKNVLGEILDVISEFHWPYELKCADGRKLEGNKQ